VKRLFCAVAACASLAAFASGEAVHFPGPGIELAARLYRPEGGGAHPAIVMLHGCNGLWARNGEPTPLYGFWAEHFRERGFVTLLVDSFGSRGEKEICTQKDRRISEARDRPRDAYAALRWLASRSDVDAKSVHVMGWSNGAMTVLNALRPDAPGRSREGPDFRSAVAFYPGCAVLARSAYRPVAPLLIQAGAADDWTPARPCIAMAKEAKEGGADVEIDVYDDAHHAFDAPGNQLRIRPDVRNPSSPTGWGATVGPNPAARAKAIERATAYIEGHR
jgi:dienelactone hydrolase